MQRINKYYSELIDKELTNTTQNLLNIYEN